jgi:hypothetical protein
MHHRFKFGDAFLQRLLSQKAGRSVWLALVEASKSAVQRFHWGWIVAVAAGLLTITYVGVLSDKVAGIARIYLATLEKSRAEQAAKAESDRRQADAHLCRVGRLRR